MTLNTLIILGMHRSGTSCLTGLLEEAGLLLGDVKHVSRYNAKGNRENPEIMTLNEAVLAANGGSWDAPPLPPLRWSGSQQDEQKDIIASYPGNRVWGFKDPRSLFTLEGWLDALPGAQLVGTFRHPSAVAQSLHNRSGMPLEEGIELWETYNRRLLKVQSHHPVKLICFDRPAEQYLQAATQLARQLGLTPPSDGFSFHDPSLRHRSPDPGCAIPAQATALYQELLELTAG